MRLPFRSRWLFWLIPFLLLGAGAWTVAGMRQAEDAALARAQRHFERRELEAALEALQPFTERRMLSTGARRRAALLFFQLGDDRQGHRMLLLQKPNSRSAEDLELKTWAERCQAAGEFLAQADKLKQPRLRREMVDAAVAQVPNSPRLLQRRVLEDLLVMTSEKGPEAGERFVEDYRELRAVAPKLAKEVSDKTKAKLQEKAP